MEKTFFIFGSILAGLAVALGAFGAHGLERLISPTRLETYEIGVRYQMYHALGLLVVSWAISHWPAQSRLLRSVGWLFIGGTVLFSGSLYILVLSGLGSLGAITPLGGVAFVTGWACMALAALRS